MSPVVKADDLHQTAHCERCPREEGEPRLMAVPNAGVPDGYQGSVPEDYVLETHMLCEMCAPLDKRVF